jgi:hypothetical protein
MWNRVLVADEAALLRLWQEKWGELGRRPPDVNEARGTRLFWVQLFWRA